MDTMTIIGLAVVAYLLGSIPSGLIIGKLFSIQMSVYTAVKISVLRIRIAYWA